MIITNTDLTNTRPQSKGYSDAGASITKKALKGFIAKSGSPQEDIDWNNYTLRQRGRMLYMASPVATAAINTNRTKVVGSGLHLKSSIDRNLLGLSEEAAKDWQNTTEAEFELWASKKENCDALGVNDFYGLQQQAIKAWLMSGDCFPLFKRYDASTLNPYSLRIHIIEADRVSTPMQYMSVPSINITEGKNPDNENEIHDGVEIDANGKIVAYWIRNTYPFQITAKTTVWKRVETFGKYTGLPNILQVMDTERCEQYRGVTYLAHVIEPLLQLRRYTESELMAALVQSFFTAWIVTQTDKTENPLNEVGPGENGSDDDSASSDQNEYEMGPGTVEHLAENEDIKFGNPNVPTAGFDPFVKCICKLVGAALEIPYDVLIKEFNSSYSAARGALEEAWDAFKMRRSWFVNDFCKPVYEIWLSESVALGRIKAPGFFVDPRIRAAWCNSRWDGPAQTHIDPGKEAKANEILVAHGWKTNEQVTREHYGGNWEKNAEQVNHENAILSVPANTGNKDEDVIKDEDDK